VEGGQEEVVVWGTGRASQEFLYVADAAQAIVLGAKHYHDPEPVNLGSGREISVKELVELIADLTGFKGRLVWETTKPDGQPRCCLDTTAQNRRLGFAPKPIFERA
jgi:GDP-L-fucose synthase